MTVYGNFEQVQLALLSLIPRVEAADEAVEETAAQIVATTAEAIAPRLTGEMAASVGSEGGQVVVTSDHAIFQEYGTRRHKAQPFLRPARDRSEPVVRTMAEGIYTVATR